MAGADRADLDGERASWRGCAPDFCAQLTSGDHWTMLEPGAVEHVAEAVTRELARAGGASPAR